LIIFVIQKQKTYYQYFWKFDILQNTNSMKSFFCTLALVLIYQLATAQNLPTENDYYKIVKVPMPEGIVLEVGGLCTMPNGDIAVSTRRGEVWIVENPTMASGALPNFRRFASGLHEILGLAYKDGNLYAAQRGELTKLIDRNGDGRADRYETIYAWPISGHYHEYSFGPIIAPDGSFFVTGNVGFGASDWWAGKSFAPGRGWTMHITEDGKMELYAAGMRSPCGIGTYQGQFIYGDNQGDWMGSGFVSFVEKGDFLGHPASLNWAALEGSPVKARKEMIFASIDPRDNPKVKPEYLKDEPMHTIYEMSKKIPDAQIKPPAVWLPHGVLGISTSEILEDQTNGGFGPFAGQVFVGDQGMSKIARVFFEKVKGTYQGASFDFRSGFRSGVLRMTWAKDNTMFVGGTNRGWGSTGKEPYGLERLVWSGQTPFEMKAVRAMPDGFEIEFTKPVDKRSAEDVNNYDVSSYTYKYHAVYGSPIVDRKENPVRGAKATDDGLRVRIVIDGLREGYIHQISPEGVKDAKEGLPLLHGSAYYTLNNVPEGAKANITLVMPKSKAEREREDVGSKLNTPDAQMKEAAPSVEGMNTKQPSKTRGNIPPKAGVATVAKAPSEKEIMGLLQKHTCLACHKTNERATGPSYKEVAQRKYSNAQLEELILQPKPENWPDFSTEMPPMAHVPKKDVQKIAAWINSLK
jgi:cytochrome c551/c552